MIVWLAFLSATGIEAQTADLSTGDVTIQLTQGLSSAANPRGVSQGQVKDSSNPAIPKDSLAMVGIAADPGGGLMVRLLQLTINGRPVRVASSAAVQVRDRSTGLLEFGRKGPKDAASGAYVLLPERTSVRFTLAPARPLPTQSAAVQSPPPNSAPPPSSWRVKVIENGGHEAAIQGFAEGAGNRGRVVLALRCTVFPPADQQAQSASAIAELRLAKGLISFPAETTDCAFDGGGNDYGSFQIGTQPETKGDFCSDGDFPASPKEEVKITLGLQQRDLIKAAGSPFHIGVQLPNAQGSALDARFQLPADAGPLNAMMDPCLQVLEEQERRRVAAIVVSCPEVPGQGLRKVDVLVTSTMKPLAPDPDNVIGVVWNLPKKTKARPVPPKTTLACFYGTGSKAVDHEALDRKLLPIPANAVTCEYQGDGHCSKLEER